MLPVDSWPLLRQHESGKTQRCAALIQHKSRQGWKIVAMYESWCKAVLGIGLRDDEASTYCVHHMWFNRKHNEVRRVTHIAPQRGPHHHTFTDTCTCAHRFPCVRVCVC